MIPGVRAIPAEPLGSQFDNFLYAPVAEESNGMLLRMVSVLARANLDPWEEAARLARLPADTAVRKLAAIIAALPRGPTASADPRTVATLLIPLLPKPICVRPPEPQAPAASASARKSRTRTSIVIYTLVMLFLLCSQWLLAHRDSQAGRQHAGAQHARAPFPGTPAQPLPRPPG